MLESALEGLLGSFADFSQLTRLSVDFMLLIEGFGFPSLTFAYRLQFLRLDLVLFANRNRGQVKAEVEAKSMEDLNLLR
jgi:hypothetical protein